MFCFQRLFHKKKKKKIWTFRFRKCYKKKAHLANPTSSSPPPPPPHTFPLSPSLEMPMLARGVDRLNSTGMCNLSHLDLQSGTIIDDGPTNQHVHCYSRMFCLPQPFAVVSIVTIQQPKNTDRPTDHLLALHPPCKNMTLFNGLTV